MAEGAPGSNGDLEGAIITNLEVSDGNDKAAFVMKPVSFFVNTGAIAEEDQNQGDLPNGGMVPNSSSDADNASQCQSDNNKVNNASDLDFFDPDSGSSSQDLTFTENSSISKSRDDKLKIAREAYERERQRKINEILEAQRQAEEFRVKQQEDRRKKIEEMRRKDQERRKTVEERRRRMLELEEERRASLLRRSQARESRIDTMRSSRMPTRMAMSCTFGSGEAAAAAFSRPRVAFGSGTPREICMPLVVEPFPAMLNGGAVGSGRSFSVYHAGCLLSAHARSHRRAASAPSGSRSAARARRDLRTGYQPLRLSSGQTTGNRPGRRTSSGPPMPVQNSDASTPDIAKVGPQSKGGLRRSSGHTGSTVCLMSGTVPKKNFGPLRNAVSSTNLSDTSNEDIEVSNLTPNRGARSASRGGTTTDSASRRVAAGQTRSASVTPSSSFVAERPGQVEKALKRGGRSADRRPAGPKSAAATDGSSGEVKLRSRSQVTDRNTTPSRPRPMSQVVTPAELDSVFARLAQPKRNSAQTKATNDSPRPAAPTKKRKKKKQKTPTTGAGNGGHGGKSAPATSVRSSSTPRPTQPKRRLPSPPRPPTTNDTRKDGPTSAASVDSGLSPSPQPTEKELESEMEMPASVEPQSEFSQDVEPQSELSQMSTHGIEPISQGQETSDSEEEPVAFEAMPSIMTQSMPAVVLQPSTKDMTEDEYRVRIAEQRRLAREKMERERQQKEEEEAARREQERLRREQARQMAEEARRRMEEEEERQRQEEEEARKQEEERLAREEEERKAREAEEARQREQAEKERLERMQKEEEERQARRARLEKIMSRVKRTDETPSPPAAAPVKAPSPAPEEEPVRGTSPDIRGHSPEVRGQSPEARGQSPSPAEAPKFKSALLQSMLGGGGLRRASGSAVNLQAAAAGSQEGMNVGGIKEATTPVKSEGMPHSFSMDALSATSRRDKEVTLPNGDADEDVDSPALMSANIHTRLEEAKAASGRALETDDSRTAFEEILSLPPTSGAVDRHLSAPVDPIPGVWFEQPSAPPREQVMTDLLS